jgi:hypothetical protein
VTDPHHPQGRDRAPVHTRSQIWKSHGLAASARSTSMKHRSLALLVSIALLAGVGCSFSHSSKSSSDSSTSPSKSSKSSSGEETARFHEDVEQYTAAYVQGGGKSAESFFSGLGELARKRGVSDWEAEQGTWESIGRGLGQAGVTDPERTAYAAAWAEGDTDRQRALDRGYEASR